TSCNNDLIVNEEKAAVLNISVPNVLTRGGNLFLDESMIAKVRIYVFDGNYVQSLHIFNSGENTFENPFKVNTTTGNKTVYVVANEHVSLSSTLDAVTTISA